MTSPKHTDTSRSGDLVERLRGDKYTCRENMGCGTMEFCACATMEDAADRIEALEAEVERLREALANLANTINIVGSPYHKAQEALDQIVTETKRAARAALGEKQ